MSEAKYWRWQTLRNAPLVLGIFSTVTAIGMVAISLVPQHQTAASRVVLETPLALNDIPRAVRSAPDVQHLQVVVHQMLSHAGRLAISDTLGTSLLSRDALDATINSGRDKPTSLTIEAHAVSEAQARILAATATDFAIETSNKLQRERVEASLTNLKTLVTKQTQALVKAEKDVTNSTVSDLKYLEVERTDLNQKITQISAKLAGQSTSAPPTDPALLALQRDLSKAKGVYSDQHPKVRLLKARIAQFAVSDVVGTKDAKPLENHLTELRTRLSQIDAKQVAYKSAAKSQTDAAMDLSQSKSALIEARLRGERSVARLKLVEDVTLKTASKQKKQAAFYATLVLIAAALGFAMAILRIRTDRRLRRPTDLTRALGLTPFATIPHLGPSLN